MSNVIKFDSRQKYAIKVAKEKNKNSIWDGFNYLTSRLDSSSKMTLGDYEMILSGEKNFKLEERK